MKLSDIDLALPASNNMGMDSRKAGWKAVLLTLTVSLSSSGAKGAFDLSGPRIDVRVNRAGKELAISQVPNLRAGDRLWLHPDLPDQGAHYLLIAAFLRGPTNPPPENWFIRADTWNRQVREEGLDVTVPEGAQQVLVFLAPSTGGDFSTLRNAVRGKPGAFVRASQELNQASLERSRADRYLDDIKETLGSDPKDLQEHSKLLARSLSLKVNQQCFDKPSEQQASCLLSQDTSDLVLSDGHSQSMVAALTSGASAQLIDAFTATPMGGGGAYGPYVGVVFDVAHLMDGLRTADYQYIPALAQPQKDQLDLKLNSPPSFHKPQSVLVVALPAVESAQLPPLRPVDPDAVYCFGKSPLVLPVDGAPLVFSTDLGHQFTLQFKDKTGQTVSLPATANAMKGGFVVNIHGVSADQLEPDFTATLDGYWGFEPFTGPSFEIRSAHATHWSFASADKGSLVVGRENVLELESESACCVDGVSAKDHAGKVFKANWELLKPDEIEVSVPLEKASPGPLELLVKQTGLSEPDQVTAHAYAEAPRLDHFNIHAGDHQGVLVGTRLDDVDGLDLNGVHFAPAGLTHTEQEDDLQMAAPATAAGALHADDKLAAHVTLKDGRVLDLAVTIAAARPKVSILSKNIQPDPVSGSPIRLGNPDDLPLDGQLSLVLKSVIPSTFPKTEKIEIASSDDTFGTFLSVTDGGLTLQDASTVLAMLDPLKAFGPSAFGPLRFRAVDASGGKGDWLPLARLVRLPSLKDVHCPDRPDQKCTLEGSNLFLIDSVASDAQFTRSVPVPIGYVTPTLTVPRPNGTLLYLKLRDDPATVDTVALPVLPDQH